MGRINILAEDGTLAGHFLSDKATLFSDGKRWDGNNMVGECSGSQWVDEYLYRTAGGKWVLNVDSTRYMSGPDRFEYVTGEQARDWLLRSKNNDEAIEKYFGDIPEEEDRRPGRPEIGEPVGVRLGDLLGAVDAFAAARGVKRAEAIRQLVTTGLACHCLCGVLHPGETGVCDMRAVTARRFESPATGPRDVPICAPCATAQGVPLPAGDGRG